MTAAASLGMSPAVRGAQVSVVRGGGERGSPSSEAPARERCSPKGTWKAACDSPPPQSTPPLTIAWFRGNTKTSYGLLRIMGFAVRQQKSEGKFGGKCRNLWIWAS